MKGIAAPIYISHLSHQGLGSSLIGGGGCEGGWGRAGALCHPHKDLSGLGLKGTIVGCELVTCRAEGLYHRRPCTGAHHRQHCHSYVHIAGFIAELGIL